MCPIISIITPIYGVEKYIERCARSLFEQTMQGGIEFIFVNDATKDKSLEILKKILKEYPNRIPQIKIIEHKVNKGLPQARYTGITHAKGEYILHVDSDDWIKPEMCEEMVNRALKMNCDVVICDYILTDGKKERLVHERIVPESIISDMMMRKVSCCVWNKLIHRTLYDDAIIYPNASMGEDLIITHQLLKNSTKIEHINTPLYYYYINSDSISRKLTSEACLNSYIQLFNNTNLLINIINENKGISKYSRELIFRKLIVRVALNPLIKEKKYLIKWFSTYPEISGKVLCNNKIGIRYKLMYLMIVLRIYPIISYLKYRNV